MESRMNLNLFEVSHVEEVAEEQILDCISRANRK